MHWRGMVGAIRIETILVVLVVLNLIGMSIAAYVIMRKK
jgi:hypothetical protein